MRCAGVYCTLVRAARKAACAYCPRTARVHNGVAADKFCRHPHKQWQCSYFIARYQEPSVIVNRARWSWIHAPHKGKQRRSVRPLPACAYPIP